MAEAAHAPFGHPCCCGDGETSEGEGAEEPAAMHHQPAVHAPARTSVEAPCHDVRDASMTATCCTIQEAADVHLATPPPPPESPKPALSDVGALPFAMPDLEAAGSAHPLARTSADPPPTSVPPRLLYAVFLI